MRQSPVKTLAVALGLFLFALTALAVASPFKDFEPAAFEAAQKRGDTVVLDYFAPWCPICRRQHKNLTELLAIPKYAHIKGFRIDYDEGQALRSKYHVTDRGTLILLNGT